MRLNAYQLGGSFVFALSLVLSFGSGHAHSFPFLSKNPVDAKLGQPYEWWLEAYALLGNSKDCATAQSSFQQSKRHPLHFCDEKLALEELVNLERRTYPKEKVDGELQRPIPDFDRSYQDLETRIRPGFLKSRAVDGYYAQSSELTCRRCSVDENCRERDLGWREELASNPILSELHRSEQRHSCQESAEIALAQHSTLKSGAYPLETYDFRFAHCTKDFPVCRISQYESQSVIRSLHLSCLKGVQSPLHLEFREKTILAVLKQASGILESCEGMPLKKSELAFSTSSVLDPPVDLFTCFHEQKSGASTSRAGLIQLSDEDFDWDRLPFVTYAWETSTEESDPNSGFLGFSQSTRRVSRTHYATRIQDVQGESPSTRSVFHSELSQIPEEGRKAIRRGVELLLEDRFRFSERLFKQALRKKSIPEGPQTLPENQVQSLSREWTDRCFEQAVHREQLEKERAVPVDET